MAYFDGIKKGDSVYDLEGKEYEVIIVEEDSFRSYSISGGIKIKTDFRVNFDGRLFDRYAGGILGQVFFWQPPKRIEPPPRPKYRGIHQLKIDKAYLKLSTYSPSEISFYLGEAIVLDTNRLSDTKFSILLQWEEED